MVRAVDLQVRVRGAVLPGHKSSRASSALATPRPRICGAVAIEKMPASPSSSIAVPTPTGSPSATAMSARVACGVFTIRS
jgi:hypothetical protein